jgi:hypothetical protein
MHRVDRMCAYIMHTAQDQFIAHVFYCEPSAGALCKTVEAACKVKIAHHSLMVLLVQRALNIIQFGI